MTILFELPSSWLDYDLARVYAALIDAKAAVMSLTGVPYQKAWAEKLQAVQLKQEVAGTSRIEGAEFTENELEAAMGAETPEEALSRSQRQARAAVNTYRWIAGLPDNRPIDGDLIVEIHRRIVTGCDDDHCPPGELRSSGQNVTFGNPRHRGVEGGKDCRVAFAKLCAELGGSFQDHDILIQALAIHYHLGAMHPFLDGNGRTSRALEALILQRAGLRDALFIALSNYYYDEKTSYLKCLSAVRADGGKITEFLIFGLKGISAQCRRLLAEINNNIKKALVRDVVSELFERLQSSRRRVIAKRQVGIINFLLDSPKIDVEELFKKFRHIYTVSDTWSAYARDIIALSSIGVITLQFDRPANGKKRTSQTLLVQVDLNWPTKITETEFFEKTRDMPRAKTFSHLMRDREQPNELLSIAQTAQPLAEPQQDRYPAESGEPAQPALT